MVRVGPTASEPANFCSAAGVSWIGGALVPTDRSGSIAACMRYQDKATGLFLSPRQLILTFKINEKGPSFVAQEQTERRADHPSANVPVHCRADDDLS